MRGTTVEEDHPLAHQCDGDGRDLSGGPGADTVRTQLAEFSGVRQGGFRRLDRLKCIAQKLQIYRSETI
jgi:hypothetical protein